MLVLHAVCTPVGRRREVSHTVVLFFVFTMCTQSYTHTLYYCTQTTAYNNHSMHTHTRTHMHTHTPPSMECHFMSVVCMCVCMCVCVSYLSISLYSLNNWQSCSLSVPRKPTPHLPSLYVCVVRLCELLVQLKVDMYTCACVCMCVCGVCVCVYKCWL